MDSNSLMNSLISIASETYRLQSVFEKAISKLETDEQKKYMSQYAWFSKKVSKALEEANLKLVIFDSQPYDPGMAATPLNIDDFNMDDLLYVLQTIEPTILQKDKVVKTGTIILGRVES